MGESDTTYQRSDLDRDIDLDDGCSSTLDSIVPPVQTKLKKYLKANGFNNTTISTQCISNLQIGNVQEKPLNKDGDTRGLRFPEMENQDPKESSTRGETLGNRLEPRETVQLTKFGNQVLKQNCEHLQGKNYDSQDVNKILEITMDQVERTRNFDVKEHNAREEKSRQQIQTMGVEIFKLQQEKMQLEMEREYKLKSDALVEKSKNLEKNHLRDRQEFLEKNRNLEEEKMTQTEKIDELQQKSKNLEENLLRERQEFLEKIRNLEEEKMTQTEKIDELQQKVGQLKNALESSKRRNANQRTISDGMVNTVDELEHQNEQLITDVDAVNAQLAAVTVERDESRTETYNLQRHNAALHDLIAQFRQRLEYFGPQIVDELRFYQQLQEGNDIPSAADDS